MEEEIARLQAALGKRKREDEKLRAVTEKQLEEKEARAKKVLKEFKNEFEDARMSHRVATHNMENKKRLMIDKEERHEDAKKKLAAFRRQ